jgi:hypothetical protein
MKIIRDSITRIKFESGDQVYALADELADLSEHDSALISIVDGALEIRSHIED